MCFLLLLSITILRRPSYKLFLRIHQALAVLVTYSTIRHLRSISKFPWLYVYIFARIVVVGFIVQLGTVIFRNMVWGRIFPRAHITRANNTIRIRITVSRPIDIKTDQYVNLWIPPSAGISFKAILSVTNWVEGKQDAFELFVQQRRGLTRKLSSHSTLEARNSIPRLALSSGPHGNSIPIGEYETVLMVATGFGIAAQLLHLRRLIYGYQTYKNHTQRVHLVW